MKFIEFVVTCFTEHQNNVILINIEDISSFKKTVHDNIVELTLKSSEKHFVVGNYKTITNRYFYTLSKKHNNYEDDIIRPSIRVLHKNELLEPDSVFMDKEQMIAFIDALIDLCDSNQKQKLNQTIKSIESI